MGRIAPGFKLGAPQRRKGRAPTTFQAGQPNRAGRPKPRALNGGEQARWHPLFGGGLRYAKLIGSRGLPIIDACAITEYAAVDGRSKTALRGSRRHPSRQSSLPHWSKHHRQRVGVKSHLVARGVRLESAESGRPQLGTCVVTGCKASPAHNLAGAGVAPSTGSGGGLWAARASATRRSQAASMRSWMRARACARGRPGGMGSRISITMVPG